MGELSCNKLTRALEKSGLKCLEKRVIKVRDCDDVTNFLKAKKEFERCARMDIIFDSGYKTQINYN